MRRMVYITSWWLLLIILHLTEAGLPETSISCEKMVKIRLHPLTIKAWKATEETIQIGPHPWCNNGLGYEIAPTECRFKQDNLGTVAEFEEGKCSPVVKEEGEYLLFTYFVTRIPEKSDGLVQRYECNQAKYTCKHKKTYTMAADGFKGKEMKQLIMKGTAKQANFDLKISFKNDQYKGDLTGEGYDVGQYVWVEIESGKTSEEILKITALTCTASPKQEITEQDIKLYPIIKNGCKVANSFDADQSDIVVDKNQESKVQFKFRSFVWTSLPPSEQKVSVHCSLHVCASRITACKSPDINCANGFRHRRYIEEADENTRYISSNIINLFPASEGIIEDPCLKNNSSCEDICSSAKGIIVCRCYQGRNLQKDGVTCVDESPPRRPGSRAVGKGFLWLNRIKAKLSFTWIFLLLSSLISSAILATTAYFN